MLLVIQALLLPDQDVEGQTGPSGGEERGRSRALKAIWKDAGKQKGIHNMFILQSLKRTTILLNLLFS